MDPASDMVPHAKLAVIHPAQKMASQQRPEIWLSGVKLSGFRNYTHASLSLDQAPVVLIGPNGAGKTNLLEAVSLLAPGRGLRRAGRDELGHKSHHLAAADANHADRWAISATLNLPSDGLRQDAGSHQDTQAEAYYPVTHKIGTGVQPEEARRLVRLNGQNAAQSDLGRLFALSWLTPQMDGLFIGSPSARRRFIDRLAIAFDPAHVGRISRYERAYRERAKLLANGAGDPHWFQSLESVLAETGVAIMATRAALIQDLNLTTDSNETGFPKAFLSMRGGGAEQLSELPALEIEDRLKAEAARLRAAGDTQMPGPQASDLTALHMARQQPAHLASTGEQKALLISIILNHARLQARRLKRPPILILDDVAAHLDGDRRSDLFAACHDLSGQIWYSGTDRSDFGPLQHHAQFFNIKDGEISTA